MHQAAQLIRDAYLGFQDAPVEGYYDVSIELLLLLCALLFADKLTFFLDSHMTIKNKL